MVYYFTSNVVDPPAQIYVGKDKFESVFVLFINPACLSGHWHAVRFKMRIWSSLVWTRMCGMLYSPSPRDVSLRITDSSTSGCASCPFAELPDLLPPKINHGSYCPPSTTPLSDWRQPAQVADTLCPQFHADNLSSAHVYYRLQDGQRWDAIPPKILEDCAQLTKANSIEGNKKDNVTVIYTPWSNLKKDGSMAVGQVGFKDQKKVSRAAIFVCGSVPLLLVFSPWLMKWNWW